MITGTSLAEREEDGVMSACSTCPGIGDSAFPKFAAATRCTCPGNRPSAFPELAAPTQRTCSGIPTGSLHLPLQRK